MATIATWLRHGAALTLVAAAAAPAHAALFEDNEARRAILDLRQRVDQSAEQQRTRQAEAIAQLNAQLTEQIAQMRRSILELNNQVEQIRSENARLRGENEQLARAVSEVQRGQKDIQQGIEERIRKVEPQKISFEGREFTVLPDEKKAYEAAMGPLRTGDFAAAAAALTAFQKRYPTSGYGESVLFWLGNAQYGKRDYKEAITTFRSLVKAAPESPRAPEALLSIANCQAELKDTKAAKATLEELVKGYPKSEAATAAKDRLAALK